jgi:hypothetical protein
MHRLLILTFLLVPLSLRANPPAFSISEKGPQIQAGAMGIFGFQPPVFHTKQGEEKPIFRQTGATSGQYEYPGGLRLDCEAEGSKLNFQFSNAPSNARSFKLIFLIPMNYNQGGKFAFDQGPLVPFPFEKGGQFVKNGHANSVTIIDPSDQGFVLTAPGAYLEIQDNRTFGWAVFGYHCHRDIQGKTHGGFSLSLEPFQDDSPAGAPSATTTKILADRFGQSARKDFRGKVRSEEELRADGVRQLEEFASFQPDPRLDTYGGLQGTRESLGLTRTGFFHLAKVGPRDVLVSPDGNVFFQTGVCGIARTDDDTIVKGREHAYEWLPPSTGDFRSAWRDNNPDSGVMSFYAANLIRKFGRPYSFEDWTGQVVQRLKSWGFNSAGAFSRYTDTMRAMNFPYVSFLPLGKGGGVQVLPDKIGAAEILDPFVPGTEEALEKKFAKSVAPKANDPLLIGYFLGNEQHFELLPKLVPTYKASQVAAKARLVQMLEEKYRDIAKFNKAWNPASSFASFEDLKEAPLFIRSDAANTDMQEFYRLYLEAYYSLVQRVFRKADPNHLLIGSRWTPGTANNQAAVEIGGKYLDVVSINYYGYLIEDAFLEKVHQWSGGRPMIFSEWYYATTGHGLGAMVELRDEKERGLAFRNYVEQSAAQPFVVGTQWFIYTDQALTGRFFEGFHGEGNNTGLVDVTDRPYRELVEAAKLTHERIYNVKLGKEKPFAFDDPRFDGQTRRNSRKIVQIPRALPGMKLDGTTTNWPGRPAESIASSRLVLGPPNPDLRGDFRLCWDDTHLYLNVQVKDKTPLKNLKTGPKLWAADGVELFLGAAALDQGGNMIFSDRQILLGASENPRIHIVDHPEEAAECRILAFKEVAGDGYVLQAAIPWNVLGIRPQSGMELLFDLMIDNSEDGHFRKQQLAWNGSSQNSDDRGSWGRARLSDN